MSVTIPPGAPYRGANITGSLSVSGQSAVFTPQAGREVYVRLSGTWTGTAKVQRSRDAGATWADMTVAGTPWAVFTANCDEAVDDPGHGDFRYRIDFVRTSGTLDYVLGH